MSKGCGCALTCLCYSLQIDAVQLLQCIYISILLAVLLLQCNCQTNNTAKVRKKNIAIKTGHKALSTCLFDCFDCCISYESLYELH